MRKERNRGRRKYASQKEQPYTKRRKVGEGEVQEVWIERGDQRQINMRREVEMRP